MGIIRITKEKLYRFIFVVWFAMAILKNTTIKTVFGVQMDTLNIALDGFVAIALFVLIWVFHSYKSDQLILIIFVTILLFISAFKSRNFILISGWLFIIAAKDNDIDNIIKDAYYTLLTMLILIISLRFLGVIADFTMYRSGKPRFSLGFSRPNVLGLRVFQLNLFRFYIKKRDIVIKDFLLCLFSAIFIYLVPNSQTSFICTLLFGFLILIIRLLEREYISNRYIVFTNLLTISSVSFNLISVILSLFDEKKHAIVKWVNKSFSLRFYYCHKVLEKYGVSFWGNKLQIIGDGIMPRGFGHIRLYLDNAYVGILLWFGILAYVMFSMVYIYMMYYYYKKNDLSMFIILFIFSLYGLMEQGTYIISHNVFLIAMSPLLYKTVGSKKRVNA